MGSICDANAGAIGHLDGRNECSNPTPFATKPTPLR